ncbi:MAG: DUF1829 domain-containing protein [Candidatus Sumerlaeota bacterium]|nr:DUF1829 domain-containing protein [Candidatus Sumerlaeota bacterium]
MIDEVRSLLDQYVAWLKEKTALRQVQEWVEITTPYLDRHNDYLQIYARRDNGGYMLTDDGYILEDLEQSGCKLESGKRKALLRTTLNGFGVRLEEDKCLVVNASSGNFALRKHSLVQAMLAVNDLFFLASPTVASLFREDVTSWVDLHEIRYTPQVKFTGKSGFDHLFDFVIPKSRSYPERIVQAINRPNRDTAEALAFAWIDTKEVRPEDSQAYAFLNDETHTPLSSILDALRNYGVKPVLWSQRESVQEELAA